MTAPSPATGPPSRTAGGPSPAAGPSAVPPATEETTVRVTAAAGGASAAGDGQAPRLDAWDLRSGEWDDETPWSDRGVWLSDEMPGTVRRVPGYPPLWPVDRAGLVERGRLTVAAAGLTLLGLTASLVLFVLTVTALGLVPIGLGALALLGLVPALAGVAGLHRRVVGRAQGREIVSVYRDTTGLGWSTRIARWAREPARWRDFAHAGFAATGGAIMAGTVACLAATPVAHFVLVWVFFDWSSLIFAATIGPSAVLWWVVTPYLMRARLAADEAILRNGTRRELELAERVAEVTRTRAETVDHSAAELRRIERDLHDGAQARLVSLAMNLGLAQELLERDPRAAAALLTEARQTTVGALDDLRGVVRGIHPPVLADRGLAGAVDALVLDIALPVTATTALPGRFPPPIESAAYFAVAECLANVVKHSGASWAWVSLRFDSDAGALAITVGDDGRGGADASRGTGLAGVARRLAAFDGTMKVTSPAGGPTSIEMSIPCAVLP